MKICRPRWLAAACVSNGLAFACFVASAVVGEATPKLLVLGVGFAVAGVYLLAVSCKPYKE